MTSMRFGKVSAFKDHITGPLLVIVLLTGFGGLQLGYDNGWWSTMIALPQFTRLFGGDIIVTPRGSYRTISTLEQSISIAFPYVFQLIGGIFAGQITHKYGRIVPLFITAVTFIVATIIEMTSSINGYRFWQIVAGKLLVAAACGALLVSVPLYIAEIAPVQIRGALVGIIAWSVVVGTLVAACVMYGLSTKLGQIVWLLPMGLQLPVPLLILAFARWLPESPRWLLDQNRPEDALISLTRVRTRSSQADIASEFALMQATIREEAGQTKGTWGDLLRAPNRLRTHIATGVSSFGPAQGFSFIAGYLVLFFFQLGLYNPLLLNIYVSTAVVVVVMISSFAQDFLGRRTLLLGGTVAMGVGMFTLAGVTTKTPAPSGSAADGCIFAIFLWVIGYTLAWASGPIIVGTEVPAQNVRDKTYAVSIMCASAVQAITAGVNAPLQKKLGGQIGFVYGTFSVIAFVWLFFLLPDLKNKSMDEIDWLFNHQIPIRSMAQTKVPELSREVRMMGQADILEPTKAEEAVEHVETA